MGKVNYILPLACPSMWSSAIIAAMVTLLGTSDIIGIIVTIALIAITLAVCVHLYGLKGKTSEEEKPSDEE